MRALEAAKQSATMTGHCRRGCKEFEDLLRGACYIGYCVVSSGLAVQPLPYVTAKRAQGKLHTHIRCHGTAPHHTTLPLPLQTPPNDHPARRDVRPPSTLPCFRSLVPSPAQSPRLGRAIDRLESGRAIALGSNHAGGTVSRTTSKGAVGTDRVCTGCEQARRAQEGCRRWRGP